MITAQRDRTPNEVAERLTGRNYVSYSALRTYASCPLKYFFKYVQGLPEQVISSSLAFGSGIHAAAELWFNELMIGSESPDQDMLLAAFWDTWRAKGTEAKILLGKGEDANSIGTLADSVLAAFRASDFAKPVGQIIGVEEELRGSMMPGVPDLLARLDLVVETEKELIVTDLKTARSRWGNRQAQEQAEQLILYAELAKHLAPNKELRLKFAVLTKTKQPVAARYPIEIDAQRVTRTKQIMQRVWNAIEFENFYPSPSPMNCSSCPFRDPCRRWPGISSI